jgi:D-3-phosphoglycerate dehydrogenase
MPAFKVVVTDYIEDNLDWEAEELRKAGIAFEAWQLKFKSEDEIWEKVKDADLIVVNMLPFPESVISRLVRRPVIIRHGIGYDNVDVAACTKHGIVFAYQPDYCTEDVAEHAIALIMACARKLFPSRVTLTESSTRGQWDFSRLFPIYRMQGKTLGVVGTGRIGSRVVEKLRNFGFRIVGNDPYLSEARRKELAIEFAEKEELFRSSDFVTIHTPLNDETRHLINARTLGWMKPTAYVINTSRGPMVDMVALAEALRSGRIAGAAIDVYDREPPPPDLPLFGMDNVILTPHIGWASVEAGWEIRRRIMEDILAVARGGRPRCVVNKELLQKG